MIYNTTEDRDDQIQNARSFRDRAVELTKELRRLSKDIDIYIELNSLDNDVEESLNVLTDNDGAYEINRSLSDACFPMLLTDAEQELQDKMDEEELHEWQEEMEHQRIEREIVRSF